MSLMSKWNLLIVSMRIIRPWGLFFLKKDILYWGGASVRRTVYSWWEASLVISSQEPVVSLGANIVRLGLSVDRQEFEP